MTPEPQLFEFESRSKRAPNWSFVKLASPPTQFWSESANGKTAILPKSQPTIPRNILHCRMFLVHQHRTPLKKPRQTPHIRVKVSLSPVPGPATQFPLTDSESNPTRDFFDQLTQHLVLASSFQLNFPVQSGKGDVGFDQTSLAIDQGNHWLRSDTQLECQWAFFDSARFVNLRPVHP